MFFLKKNPGTARFYLILRSTLLCSKLSQCWHWIFVQKSVFDRLLGSLQYMIIYIFQCYKI